mmetsp:Transcript_3318/g.9408  ORF Transcript_3318/g.9408 Transcript_3318/m.9408 type:complete len:272 (-) Transcript_3318:215-1030(-)
MDDDAPLSALAKAPKFDDDTPLVSLAGIGGKPKTGPRLSSSPGKVGQAKAKGRAKKQDSGSSSSSSSSGSSSSGSDSDTKKGGVKKLIQKSQKLKLLRKLQTEETVVEDGGGAVKKKDRSPKEALVADLLCRWWYVFPDWPPSEEEYYQAELQKRSLRKVSMEEWEWLPELDEKGRRKVYELSQYRGMFRNSAGELIDVRPHETCPCYANFMKKDVKELWELLVVAYQKQLEDLKNSCYNEEKTEADLQVLLLKAREKAHQAKQVVGSKHG